MKPIKYIYGYMNPDLQYFAWARPVQGYDWEDATAGIFPAMRLTPDDKRDQEEKRFLRWRDTTSAAKSLTPLLDNPTLFRQFANLQPTEAAYQEFANQYGWLGVSCFLREESSDGKSYTINLDNLRSQGEPLWRWHRAHRDMQRVSAVLEAIQAQDYSALKQWFNVSDNAVRYERTGPHGEEWELVSAVKPAIKPWLWKWAHDAQGENARVVRFASGWAQKYINEAMNGTERGTSTSVRVLLNDIKDGMMLHIVPDTLLAAMWLQCARVLTDNPTFKACEHCGKWFELSPSARRKQSKYCSGSCKVAAHRARNPVTRAPKELVS